MKKFILPFILFLIFAGNASAEVITEEVKYAAGETPLIGFIAYDDSIKEKRPGILVVHEWWGHNDYVRRRARMLAAAGYVAFALDMYGDGKSARHPDEAGQFASAVMQDVTGKGRERFLKALTILQRHPLVNPEKIAAIGYCFGGGIVLNMARLGVDLKGVVSFHGSLAASHPAQAGTVKARVLVCHGAEDSFITPEQIESFKKEMETAGVDYTFIAYPGAKHSFTNPDADKLAEEFNMAIAYNKEADQKSWQDMLNFFDGIFRQ